MEKEDNLPKLLLGASKTKLLGGNTLRNGGTFYWILVATNLAQAIAGTNVCTNLEGSR